MSEINMNLQLLGAVSNKDITSDERDAAAFRETLRELMAKYGVFYLQAVLVPQNKAGPKPEPSDAPETDDSRILPIEDDEEENK